MLSNRHRGAWARRFDPRNALFTVVIWFRHLLALAAAFRADVWNARVSRNVVHLSALLNLNDGAFSAKVDIGFASENAGKQEVRAHSLIPSFLNAL